MDKKLIIAIALSALVVIVFQKIVTPPVQVSQGVQANVSQNAVTPGGEPQYAQAVGQSVVKSAATEPIRTYVDEKAYHSKEVLTRMETDKFIITFSNIGGSIRSIDLLDYKTDLVEGLPAETAICSLNSENIPGLAKALFSMKQEPGKIIYTYEIAQAGLWLTKEYSIRNSLNSIDLQIFIINASSTPIALGYDILGPFGVLPATSIKGRNFLELNAMLDGRILRKSNIKSQKEIIPGIISWVASKNRYFAIAMQPPSRCSAMFVEKVNGQLGAGVITQQAVIQPGVTLQDSYMLYIGPLLKQRLSVYKIGLEGLVNFGIFGGISTLLMTILAKIHDVFHNWGVAIILVTMLINIVLFPLTKKSLTSMQKMQEIQPHMEKLRKLHKDNPQKMNKEVMEVYRQYNVNPFGGCLPMILQLPVFIAFYQALMRSIELKGAHFLWIKDLSSPDALFTFHQTFPFIGNTFNLLPILTMIIMVLQQKVTSAGSGMAVSEDMAKQQKLMGIFFPIFFGFILYNFPSGLVLYWFTNSLLMTGEQYYLRKHMNKAKAT